MGVDDFRRVLVLLEDGRLVTSCIMAGFAMLLYDHLLTLGQEISLVWPTPWSLGKIVFVATRYFPLIDGALLLYYHTAPPWISTSQCTLLYRSSGWLIVWGILVAELVLVFRTWAIWGRSSKVAIGLLLFLSLLAIPTGIFTYIGLGHAEFGLSPYPLIESCWLTKSPNPVLFLNYIMVVIFESVILALTVYKGLQHLRHSNSRLVWTLYFDGVLYYVYLIGFSLANIAILAASPKPGPSFIFLQRVLHSTLTARILLNLREAANRDRAYKAVPSNGREVTVLRVGQQGQQRTRTALSSVVIGVDTWFQNPVASTQGLTIELV